MFDTFISALLLATAILLVITRLEVETIKRHHHGQKIDFFRTHPVQPGDIVFLGDSLTDGARWDELFPGLPVKNRGINADTTQGVLKRLDNVVSGHPAAIFILIGTNDLAWYEYRSDTAILDTYAGILKHCKNASPATRVFVQSLLPRHPRYTKRIMRLNTRLEALAAQYDCTYVNLYPHFAAPNGGIRPELTNDNLHLLGEGYAMWVKQLTPHIENLIKHVSSE